MLPLEKCEAVTILLSRMHSDLQVYCETVAELSRRDGTPLEVVYGRTEHARLAFERAWKQLKEHTSAHGCLDKG
jgi:hypothetical protein